MSKTTKEPTSAFHLKFPTMNAFIFLFLMASSSLMAQITVPQALNDTKTFEVSACFPTKDRIITAFMEKRPARKDNNENGNDMRVAYKFSGNNGKTWTEKGIIDVPNTFGIGNPFVANNEKGDTYLVCMNIGMNFYSGNISFYEFDFRTKQFNLKSVPIKSDDKLLDKPSIACFGNEIHLVYTAYTKNFKTSVRYQMSRDKGKTWTEAVDVLTDPSLKFVGPSVKVFKGKQIVVSVGTYLRKNIYFIKKKMSADSTSFDKPIIVGKVSNTLGTAVTEISTFDNKLLITWQDAHQRNETWMSFSDDEGNTWAPPHMITNKGNLLAAAIDKIGNINCIYSDFNNQSFFVGYKSFNSKYEILKEANLIKPIPSPTFNEYLGAYQSLTIRNNEAFAFWIDYPNNSTLNFSTWKIN